MPMLQNSKALNWGKERGVGTTLHLVAIIEVCFVPKADTEERQISTQNEYQYVIFITELICRFE